MPMGVSLLLNYPKSCMLMERLKGGWTQAQASGKLASREGAQQRQLEFHDLPSVDSNRRGSYGLPLTVSTSALTVYYSLGDPDEVRRVTFEKK
jgi:hypothetical protein